MQYQKELGAETEPCGRGGVAPRCVPAPVALCPLLENESGGVAQDPSAFSLPFPGWSQILSAGTQENIRLEIPGETLYTGVVYASTTPSSSTRLRSEWGWLTLLFGKRHLGKDVWMVWWHCPRSLSLAPLRDEALWPPLTTKLQATRRTLFFFRLSPAAPHSCGSCFIAE